MFYNIYVTTFTFPVQRYKIILTCANKIAFFYKILHLLAQFKKKS